MNLDNVCPKYREFAESLKDKRQDWIGMYIMAVNEGMDYHAFLILESGNINLNNNNDPKMLQEIKTCIVCGDDNYLEKYIEDGYTPSEHHLYEILDFYSTRKEESYNISIFNHFNKSARRIKIQKINSKTLSGKPQQ